MVGAMQAPHIKGEGKQALWAVCARAQLGARAVDTQWLGPRRPHLCRTGAVQGVNETVRGGRRCACCARRWCRQLLAESRPRLCNTGAVQEVEEWVRGRRRWQWFALR